MIIGMNGIPLSYVIRDNDETDISDQTSWSEKAILSAPHEGINYVQYQQAVHNIMLRNIADGSDAFTYIKDLIIQDNGRTDTKALRDQYENASIQEQYVSEAKGVLALLT